MGYTLWLNTTGRLLDPDFDSEKRAKYWGRNLRRAAAAGWPAQADRCGEQSGWGRPILTALAVDAMRASDRTRREAMSRLIQPLTGALKRLEDSRSTGALAPIRSPEVSALRGTFKGRR